MVFHIAQKGNSHRNGQEQKNKKKRHITAVLRDCEICDKFTFIFRKKFYLSRKFSVPKFATSRIHETLVNIL